EVPSPEGPLLHRRRLGDELRRLRGERTLEEVAAGTLISTSKLSRLENGQGVPQPRDIRDLVTYFRLDAQAADRLRRSAHAGRRQQLRLEPDTAVHLIVLLDEAVLHRPFGSVDDRRAQLDHLVDASRRRNVSLQVVPFAAGLHAGLQGLPTVLQYADDGDRDI